MIRSPEQQFAFAKRLPIQELAKVLQGQSDVVDMSIAEMVLRQKTQAQKAQQGMEAQQMAQSPKVVEKDLMEAGVAAMPAPNMEQMDGYAGGGIVAFQPGGAVGAPLQSTRVPGAGPTFASAFPDVAAAEKAAAEAVKASGGRISFTAALKRFLGPAYGIYEMARFHKTGMDYDTGMGFGTPEEQMTVGTIMQSPRERVVDRVIAAKPVGQRAEQPSNAPAAPETAVSAAPQNVLPPADESGIASLNQQISALRKRLTKPTLEGSAAEVEEMYKKAGVSTDPFAEYKKSLAEEKTQTAADRREAGWMRALEAGLGIMGGESPYAFANIGKGAQAAAKGAMEDIKEFKKLDRERNRALGQIAVAENDLKRGITDKKISRYDEAMQRYNAADMKLSELELGINVEKFKLGQTRGLKVDEIALKEANDQIQKEMVTNPGLAQDPTKYRQRLNELYTGFKSALMGKGITQPAGAPQGRVVNGVYVPAGR